MKFSVLVCTHNPRRDYLERVLAALAGQRVGAVQWELVVVDNASNPGISHAQLTGMPVLTRVISVPVLGVLHARIAGLTAASGDAIVFVDDDNVLGDDYLAQAAGFLAQHPEVGAAGGAVEPEFEVRPPGWLRHHHELLAVRMLGSQPVISSWSERQTEYPWCAPFGAGMVMRAACARRFLEVIPEISHASIGRKGTAFLGGCEDAELVLHGALRAGYEVAYTPGLRLKHLIPFRRLRFAYLSQLAFETGVTWGEFCVRNGFMTPVPRWGALLRIGKGLFRTRAWRREGWLTWRSSSGRLIGRSRAVG